MVIIQVAGGLGNQLQQYAIYLKFVRMGVAARLDTSWFEDTQHLTNRKLELALFDRLHYEVCTQDEKAELIGSTGMTGKLRRKLLPFTVHQFQETQMYHPELFEFRNRYIQGYFACEKYYADILYELREKLQFPPCQDTTIHAMNMGLVQEMQTCESVSVHIRRGDYLSTENADMFGNICTEAYYDRAIQTMQKICKDPHFYIFSDDMAYAKKQYQGEEYTIVDINHGQNSFYDMWLMSNCKHNICANSTFSFWGARLNGNEYKTMIRPTIHKNSQVYNKEEMAQLWTGWKFISPVGKLS